ncbi:MAG: TetR/AcrR family transcriptional regulator [Desulfovibrio sp.]|nr:TetR/AcrR family transcriptional regulator [Desulfovibrio sp.]
MPRSPKKAVPPGDEPRPPARGRPREFDRAAALNAAMEVFWRKGYMQTTLGDLCAAMGIKAPSFYCAFGTRAELFLETVEHYRATYWNRALERLLAEKDIFAALEHFIDDAVRIYMRPGLPRGCFIGVSTVGLAADETRIREALAASDRETEALFRSRLAEAVRAGQLPPESDLQALTGAFLAFLKGIALLSRGEVGEAELTAIARRGVALLPGAPEVR